MMKYLVQKLIKIIFQKTGLNGGSALSQTRLAINSVKQRRLAARMDTAAMQTPLNAATKWKKPFKRGPKKHSYHNVSSRLLVNISKLFQNFERIVLRVSFWFGWVRIIIFHYGSALTKCSLIGQRRRGMSEMASERK